MSFFKSIKSWFSRRFAEPSSWVAVGGLLSVIGVLADIEEAPLVVNAIVSHADALAGGEYTATGFQILGGLALMKGFIKPDNFND